MNSRLDRKLAEQGGGDTEEQGGQEFVKEVSLLAAQVAQRAAEWSDLVVAEVRDLLPQANRLEAAMRSARRRVLSRRQAAARKIRRRTSAKSWSRR